MPDDIVLNSGSGGETLATDQAAGGEHYQVVKLADGTADSTTHIPLSGTLANGLDVDVTRVGGTVTVDNAGTFACQIDGDALTALQVIDNAVHVDDAAFTLGTSSGMMMMGFAGTQSVNANDAAALACDTDGALHISDGGNTITVDGTITANAGTGTFTVDGSGVTQPVSGTVTANLSATDNAVLDQIEVNTSYGDQTGGGTEASALRVTIANDSTGVISIDDGGNVITVDGTVTANLSATDNAVLDNIDTNTSKGASHYRNIDANAEAEIKGSAGTLHWIQAINLTASVAYLHLYDAIAASVTPGSTTPTFTFAIPTQGDTNGAGFNLRMEHAFANGITLVCTTTLDGSAGDPGTNGVIVNAGYT